MNANIVEPTRAARLMAAAVVITALVLAALVAAPALHAGTDAAAACAAAKRKAAGKKALDEMKCHATAARLGADVDGLCLQRAEATFTATFARAEQAGGCVTVNDEAALEGQVDGFVTAAVAALPVGP
jgi:hypothetical protein